MPIINLSQSLVHASNNNFLNNDWSLFYKQCFRNSDCTLFYKQCFRKNDDNLNICLDRRSEGGGLKTLRYRNVKNLA